MQHRRPTNATIHNRGGVRHHHHHLHSSSSSGVAAPLSFVRVKHQHRVRVRAAAAAESGDRGSGPTTAAEAMTSSSDRADAEARVRALESAAMDAHKRAQELNKAARFDDALAMYEEMRRLDAEALALANSLGCPSCRSNEGGGGGGGGGAITAEASRALEHTRLTPMGPWPPVEGAADRALGALLGAAVADAAATGVQWVYDLSKLHALLAARGGGSGSGSDSEDVEEARGGVSDPGLEFHDPPQSPFLPGYAPTRSGPYGEGALVLLRSVARAGGLDPRDYARRLAAAYGPVASSSGSASSASGSSISSAGGGGPPYPDSYRNASVVAFLRANSRGLGPPDCGADDAQADCVTRLPPLAAAFAGHVQLMPLVTAATRTLQNTDAAAAWARAGAAVLDALITRGSSGGGRVADAVAATADELERGSARLPACELNAEIAANLRTALALRGSSTHAAAIAELGGRNCHLPNCATTPIHAALRAEWYLERDVGDSGNAVSGNKRAQAAFRSAIRDALAAGGCCASRAGFAGALLGAALGRRAVPPEWVAKAECSDEVVELFGLIDAARGGGGSGSLAL